MSRELETLDQLLGGDMSLALIRRAIYPDDRTFLDGVAGLLICGDARLMRSGMTVADWEQRSLFSGGAILQHLDYFQLALTEQGCKRIS